MPPIATAKADGAVLIGQCNIAGSNDFSAQGLADILSNRFYIGELTHGDVKRRGNQQALVGKGMFGKVQAFKERNRKR